MSRNGSACGTIAVNLSRLWWASGGRGDAPLALMGGEPLEGREEGTAGREGGLMEREGEPVVPPALRRVPTGVPGLDEVLLGGLVEGGPTTR